MSRSGLIACVVLFISGFALAGEPVGRPVLEDGGYGERLGVPGDVAVWWCDATRKVGRNRPVPEAKGEAVRLSAARDEFEAAQVVVRAREGLKGLTCRVSELAGPGGGRIPRDQIQALRVRYVKVTTPTDKVGQVGEWPDPLPSFADPIDVPANVNQPIWVLVHVPRTAAPGDYEGKVELSAEGWSAVVPIRLHVWNFTLPDTPRTQSAFGLGMGTVYRYHNVTRPEDKRALFAKYMQSFSDHRISPYNPTPFDAIEYKFLPDADPPRTEVKFDRFDAAMQQAIERWHITSFNLHIPGMGGGTFHERHEGELAGHKAGTPKYETMFASMVQQLEAHFKEKGWLDKAYVYWFDEPDPKDYEFVRTRMDRIHKSAPGFRRMLTEQPEGALLGAVDLWCPITPEFKPERAAPRMAAGEQFWWYVCTGPKEPYCTLFIDHPATDLRVWLWQTWQRKISGILIWETTWWTSDAAFPDSLQNPYEDPMAYVSGYSTPKGTKKHWGNGDGRFLYPPESAAGGSKEPNLDPPVSSIRWEMLREGVEDLDYLHTLQDRIWQHRRKGSRGNAELLRKAQTLLEVPPDITESMAKYTYDSRPIYERRKAVAEMIERLGRSQ